MKENALRLAQTLFLLAKRHALALVLVCLGLTLFTSRYQLAINFTESLPGTVFLIDKKDRRVEKGELIAFTWKGASPIPDGVTVIKRVAGVPGERVHVENRFVFIDRQPVGIAKTLSRTGEPLTHISDGVIPRLHFFAAGDHMDSFDSRYAKPGLIPFSSVRGRAYSLW